MKALIKRLLQLTDIPSSTHPPAAFRLCDDVLISIFMLNVEQLIDVDNYMDSEIPWGHRPILQCTTRQTSQVCRRWRVVALTCPALWRNIELSSICTQWIQEMINRATRRRGFGRLFLTCYSRDALSQITPELLSKAYSYYGIVSTEVWSLLTNELTSPTTKLNSIFIFPSLPPNSSFVLTPSLIFKKPFLKRLFFDSYFPIDITHSNLSSVTTLVIRKGLMNSQVLQYAFSEVLSSLANMPLLQELSLFVLPQDGIHPLHSINLPFLARLKLSGSYFLISLLLSHIDFPLSCSLRISCEESSNAAPPTSDIIYRIAAPVAKHMAHGFTHNLKMSLCRNSVSIKELPLISNSVSRNSRVSGWYSELSCVPFFTATAEWIVVFDQIITIFHGIFQTTTHLTLASSIDVYFPASLVIRVLQPFIALNTINLDGYSNFMNLVSLLRNAGENGEEILPVLRNLELSRLSGESSSLDALINFLAWRFERNKSLHTFEFHLRPEKTTKEIYLTERQLSQLQRFVVNINVYYIKWASDNYSWRLVKTAFLHSKLRNANGYCRLEPFRDILDDGYQLVRRK